MTKLTLIHGACHGGWAFDFLRPELEALGHDTIAPTLTGMGDRVSELTPDVTALTHANDIIEAIEKTAWQKTVLVGHSYAGGPMTQAHAQIPDKIEGLIYLDAFVPLHNQSLFDVIDKNDQQKWRALAKKAQTFYVTPDASTIHHWGIHEPQWIDYLLPKITPFAIPWYEPKLLWADNFHEIAKGYIRFSQKNDLDGLIEPHALRAKRLKMHYMECKSHHEAILTDAKALAPVIQNMLSSLGLA